MSGGYGMCGNCDYCNSPNKACSGTPSRNVRNEGHQTARSKLHCLGVRCAPSTACACGQRADTHTGTGYID